MKSSILERKIKEDPLTWGTPEMIRAAKQRKKSGLSVNLNDNESGSESSGAAPSPAAPTTSAEKTESKNVEQQPTVPTEAVPYPKIRAKYDAKIATVKASKAFSQSDKKARIKHFENRYQNEIKEKKYQKFVMWSFAGFLVVVAILIYVRSTLL